MSQLPRSRARARSAPPPPRRPSGGAYVEIGGAPVDFRPTGSISSASHTGATWAEQDGRSGDKQAAVSFIARQERARLGGRPEFALELRLALVPRPGA